MIGCLTETTTCVVAKPLVLKMAVILNPLPPSLHKPCLQVIGCLFVPLLYNTLDLIKIENFFIMVMFLAKRVALSMSLFQTLDENFMCTTSG